MTRGQQTIKGIYILRESGECLVSLASKEHETDEQLFSGFVSAVLSFAREIGAGELSGFMFKEEKVYCLRTRGLIGGHACKHRNSRRPCV
ncbi:MAG: hypothetical protein ACTSXJ_05340 [Candidatus Baldrarchaeia archaeon]